MNLCILLPDCSTSKPIFMVKNPELLDLGCGALRRRATHFLTSGQHRDAATLSGLENSKCCLLKALGVWDHGVQRLGAGTVREVLGVWQRGHP